MKELSSITYSDDEIKMLGISRSLKHDHIKPYPSMLFQCFILGKDYDPYHPVHRLGELIIYQRDGSPATYAHFMMQDIHGNSIESSAYYSDDISEGTVQRAERAGILAMRNALIQSRFLEIKGFPSIERTFETIAKELDGMAYCFTNKTVLRPVRN